MDPTYITRLRVAAIERACEQALQGGRCGVLVDEDRGTAEVSPAVPYGHVAHLPWKGGPGWGLQNLVLAS